MCGPQLSRRWDRFLGRTVSTSALLFSATHWPKVQRAGFGDTAPRRKPGQRSMAPKGQLLESWSLALRAHAPQGKVWQARSPLGPALPPCSPPPSLGRLRSPQALWG